MKDIRNDLTTELADGVSDDPVKAAQKLSAPKKLKRFYKKVDAVAVDGFYQLELDGRVARTPAKKLLAVKDSDYAQILAAEWDAQKTEINPAKMPYTRLANSAIDGVAPALKAVLEDIVKFADSDLLFYRAEAPEGLVARQRAAWDPVLSYFEAEHNAQFKLTEGLVHLPQPQESVAKISETVEPFQKDHMALAGLQVMTTISGSVLLALAAALGFMDRDDAWMAAHVDEDWNIEQWGEDAEAQQRRAYRKQEFATAYMAVKALSYQ